MVTLPDIIKRFYFNQTGEVTGMNYAGYFAVKVVLTLGEKLEVEKKYAQLLPNDKNANSENKLIAATLAELDVRVVEGPSWWTRSQSGQQILDTQIIWGLMIKIQELTEEWKKEVNELAQKVSNVVPPTKELNQLSPQNSSNSEDVKNI